MPKLTNKQGDKIVPIMHGENFLVPVDKLPKGEIIQSNAYIVGHSETGHHHVLESKQPIDIVEGVDRVILVREVSKLFHQKSHDIHETIEVQPGIYKITHKTEYNPFTKVIGRVFD